MSKLTLELLEQEISKEFEELQNLEVGSAEHAKAVGDLQSLITKQAELERLENDNTHKEIDEQLRVEAREEQEILDEKKAKRDFMWKAAGIGLTFLVETVHYLIRRAEDRHDLGVVLCYEEEGSFTKKAAQQKMRDLIRKADRM